MSTKARKRVNFAMRLKSRRINRHERNQIREIQNDVDALKFLGGVKVFDEILDEASKHFAGQLPTSVPDPLSLPWTGDDDAWALAVDKAVAG